MHRLTPEVPESKPGTGGEAGTDGMVGGDRSHHSLGHPRPMQNSKEFKHSEFEIVFPRHYKGIFVKVGE